MPPPMAVRSTNRGGSTSVSGRIRSPRISGGRWCLYPRQLRHGTDRRKDRAIPKCPPPYGGGITNVQRHLIIGIVVVVIVQRRRLSVAPLVRVIRRRSDQLLVTLARRLSTAAVVAASLPRPRRDCGRRGGYGLDADVAADLQSKARVSARAGLTSSGAPVQKNVGALTYEYPVIPSPADCLHPTLLAPTRTVVIIDILLRTRAAMKKRKKMSFCGPPCLSGPLFCRT